MNNAHALKVRLPRTWDAFFGRHGNFTSIQLQAIPLLLDGQNVLLHAGTASGKTEAALAPLIERHLPADRPERQLTLLYLLPTRALINDMFARLAAPLNTLRLTAAVKTRDFNTFNPRRPTDVLLTTPESMDSLMASEAKTLIGVRAIIIDELHIFDSSVRGDQLRVLLNRLRALRVYAAAHDDAPDDRLQYAALSATLAQPAISAARYYPDAQIISTGEQRPLHFESIALEEGKPSALLAAMHTFRAHGWKKALAFCNTRAEVEFYAAQTRAAQSPFGDQVFVHYSNLERERRREIEQQFAQAEAAICFASSTLELGIDIGSIDVVLLIGVPGSVEAFTQRIGRASRRSKTVYALGFYRTRLEQLLFTALVEQPVSVTAPSPFRPSAAIQQLFSLIKASPTGGIRINPILPLFDGMLSGRALESVVGELQAASYLKPGRSGEWRAGDRLNRLVDLQASEHAPFSLYSNIETNSNTLKIRDQHTQRVIANVDRLMFDRHQLLLEGRPVTVEWVDGEALWVSPIRTNHTASRLIYRSTRPVLSYEMAQMLPPQLGLTASSDPFIQVDDEWLWFHFLGDLYGYTLLELLRYTVRAESHEYPGICVLLADEPRSLPIWTAAQVSSHLYEHYRRYERMLALGAYHHLLPRDLRRRAVIEQFDIPRFLTAALALKPERAPETLILPLQELVTKHADSE